MRLYGRLISLKRHPASYDIQDFYVLGSYQPEKRLGPIRQRVTIEVEMVYEEDGAIPRPGDEIQIHTTDIPERATPRNQLQVQEYTSRPITFSKQDLEAAEAEIRKSMTKILVPAKKPEPEPPKEPTRWNQLEID